MTARTSGLTASDQAPADASGITHGPWAFVVAVLTAVTAVVALAIGVLTPAHAGPYCRSDCVGYPYTGGAEFVPRDFWWQYPAILVALLAVVLMMVLPRRPSARATLAACVAATLATIAAGVLVTDYAIQLTVVQPGLLKKETDGLGLWSQFNPHGVFIALENAGYLLMALAFLAIGMAMAAHSRSERVARIVFIAGGTATPLALIGYAAAYQADLDYRFEVAGIGIDWLVLIIAGALLAVASRARRNGAARSALPAGGCFRGNRVSGG
jgi:hypothetical protein